MEFTEQDILNLQRKATRYNEVLNNTQQYRALWQNSLKAQIVSSLSVLIEKTQLPAVIEERADITNLEAIVVNLGAGNSGLAEPVGSGLRRDLVKNNGSLVYQQLFNGKVLVLINYPFIEKYGQPQPPKTIAVYRPEELKDPYFLRHMESFISEITQWEDYDDDLPEPNQRIGFKLNFQDEKKA